jgi:hypothetical protein
VLVAIKEKTCLKWIQVGIDPKSSETWQADHINKERQQIDEPKLELRMGSRHEGNSAEIPDHKDLNRVASLLKT